MRNELEVVEEANYWSAKEATGRGKLVKNQLARRNGPQIRKLTP
jgi:hypothetical protein